MIRVAPCMLIWKSNDAKVRVPIPRHVIFFRCHRQPDGLRLHQRNTAGQKLRCRLRRFVGNPLAEAGEIMLTGRRDLVPWRPLGRPWA